MNQTRRRQFLIAVGALAVPGSILAQPGARMHRVAVVFTGSVDAERTYLEAFLQGLRQHGYREGVSVKLEVSYAEGRTERALALIREAVARRPDVIVLRGSAASWAAKKATATIPIVMAMIGDPVGQGLIASLSRPGGNITGNAILAEAYTPKSLELLHEALPEVRTFGVLTDPTLQVHSIFGTALQDAAKGLRIALERFDASTPEEIDRALGDLARRRPGALLVMTSPLFDAHRRRIIESLARDRIPAILGVADAADLGALMSYQANALDIWRKAATYVHRILQGAKPSELPFEQATRFELVVNLKTAKALGIKIPGSILLRADRVIE